MENGVPEFDEKQLKKQRKNREKVKEPQNDAVSLATETPTLTIAVPVSIIDNAQSLELATCAVMFDSKSLSDDALADILENHSGENECGGTAFLIRTLRYLETPQYLQKSLFPKHNSLRFVGLLTPLDALHHLRKHEWASYREDNIIKIVL